MTKLKKSSIERAMDECDRLTTKGFLDAYGFGYPRSFWVTSPRRAASKKYPAKAIAAVALGLDWKKINGGYSKPASACNLLEKAGYSIEIQGKPKVVAKAACEKLDALMKGLPNTEREQLVKARIGQDIFRQLLLERSQKRCEVTGLKETALLRASHIKPWQSCGTDTERLDVNNGIMLSVLWDAAFDRGLISFDNEGLPIASKSLGNGTIKALNLNSAKPLKMNKDRARYLAWHREHCFKG